MTATDFAKEHNIDVKVVYDYLKKHEELLGSIRKEGNKLVLNDKLTIYLHSLFYKREIAAIKKDRDSLLEEIEILDAETLKEKRKLKRIIKKLRTEKEYLEAQLAERNEEIKHLKEQVVSSNIVLSGYETLYNDDINADNININDIEQITSEPDDEKYSTKDLTPHEQNILPIKEEEKNAAEEQNTVAQQHTQAESAQSDDFTGEIDFTDEDFFADEDTFTDEDSVQEEQPDITAAETASTAEDSFSAKNSPAEDESAADLTAENEPAENTGNVPTENGFATETNTATTDPTAYDFTAEDESPEEQFSAAKTANRTTGTETFPVEYEDIFSNGQNPDDKKRSTAAVAEKYSRTKPYGKQGQQTDSE